MLALPIRPVYRDMKLTDSSLKSHSMVGSIGTENMMQCELAYLGISNKLAMMGIDLHLQLSSTKPRQCTHVELTLCLGFNFQVRFCHTIIVSEAAK